LSENNPLDEEAPARLRRWLVPRLRSWFDLHARALPWRLDRNPYRIWVSEVMLQQTQVATVIPFFARFLARFPTLPDLAAANEQDVLRLWEGLGYYRRARDLLAAARRLVADHAGTIPADPAALAGLPGMGEYTRNAVLSQAFDLRLPILEANTQRLLSRLFGYEEDPRQGPARRRLWRAAEQLLPTKRVGDFNQALMELGALVCTPLSPACTDCPLAPRCQAFQTGRQNEIPRRSLAPATTYVQEAAVVVRRAGKVLLLQRPATGRWAGLWEFPHGPLQGGESHEEAASRLARHLGLQFDLGPESVTIAHGITRYHITLVCFEAAYRAGEVMTDHYPQAAWVEPGRLGDYPVSAPQRRLARHLTRPDTQRRLF
jgi:A/G-specific adenine glycosylase